MARSLWKGPYRGYEFIKTDLNKGQKTDKKVTSKQKVDSLTYSRSSVILKEWIGLNLGVHNGKTFIPVLILPPMVGRKLGEFSRTRIKPVHPVKKGKARNTPKGGK